MREQVLHVGQAVHHKIEVDRDEAMASFQAEAARFESVHRANVEFMWCDGGEVEVFVSMVGKCPGKSRCCKAFERGTTAFGYGLTNVSHNRHVNGLVLGQLVPDLAIYLYNGAGVGGGAASGAADHCHVAVEIDFFTDARAALAKTAAYMNADFVGPHDTQVQEVWNIFIHEEAPLPLAHYNPPAMVGRWTLPQPPPLPKEPFVLGNPFLLPFDGLDFGAAAAALLPPAVVVVTHRNAVGPPTKLNLQWNTRIGAPAGSLLAGLDLRVNNLLREVYDI